MRNRTVMGIFERASDAEKAKEELLEAGIARHRIVVSRLGAQRARDTDDAIVGELPDPEKLDETRPRGACMVSVVARTPLDREHIARLMLRLGARETLETRA